MPSMKGCLFYQISHFIAIVMPLVIVITKDKQIALFLSFLLSRIILCVKYPNVLGHSFQDSEGMFLLPEDVEVDSIRHVVVYDSNTSCLQEQGHWILHRSTQQMTEWQVAQ